MSTLIGILVDVSGSMKNSVTVGDGADVEGGSWARSIFKVVDELIKHDVSSSNQTFALAFGSRSHSSVIDLLSTIDKAQKKQSSIEELSSSSSKSTFENTQHDQSSIEELRSKRSTESILNEALAILETSGAPRVRKWAKMDVLLKVVDKSTAAAILYFLQKSPDFTRKFVFKCLPKECREFNWNNIRNEGLYFMAGLVPGYGDHLQAAGTEDSVREAITKGKNLIAETMKASVEMVGVSKQFVAETMKAVVEMVGVSKAAIRSVHNASEILHAGIGDQEITNERIDELLNAVEPFIYGGTPLMQAMRDSVNLFSNPEFANHRKLLFILSDGQPDPDEKDPPLQELSDLGVTIVSCYITGQSLSDPRRLYSTLHESWGEPAKTMFRMSSTIPTHKILRTLFVGKKKKDGERQKRGWKIDIDNNETRLFFQVNHPKIIEEVCDMAKNAVLSQDALSDILSSVDLDFYINKVNEGFGPKKQHGSTCYANASAAVLHLAMKSIIGRDDDYPDFFELRRKLIDKYGDGEVRTVRTIEVLKEICPAYRLQCEEVDVIGAMKAISEKRPVVALFYLTEAQWDQFDQFYEDNPKGILTGSFLTHDSTSDRIGHAVVLTSYDAESLRLMNSWGDGWADDGFFRVQNSDVFGFKFVDVFWTLDDLSENEKKAYDQHGAEVAAKLMRSLKGIQLAKYDCPLCAIESLVVDYSGHLLKAKCPKCRGIFNANEAGGDLALNLYLTSLP